MPSNCVICGNSAMKDPGVSFHRLPSSAERKRQWLEAFDVPEEEWCTHWRVCSRHFPDGNPKAAPLSYREDQFAAMWSLRKRAKLDHSRTSGATPPSSSSAAARQHQAKRNNLNSILALRGPGPGALSLPVINNTTAVSTGTASTSVSGEDQVASLHTRVPPVLLPVASLQPNRHLVGGAITVIKREPLNQHSGSVPTSIHHQLHKGSAPGGIHIHELVVMPEVGPSTDEATSESSETDESPTTGARNTGGGAREGQDEEQGTSGPNQANHIQESRGGNKMTAYYGGASSSVEGDTVSRTNHVSRSDQSESPSRVCHTQSRPPLTVSHPNDRSRDVSVVVQGALLARVSALENDNQQLRQKLSSSSHTSLDSPSPVLGVCVADSTTGKPAEGLTVEASVWQSTTADWTPLGSGVTGAEGECCCLLSQPQLSPGLYRLHFDTQSHFSSKGLTQPHYPYVEVVFRIHRATSYHRVTLQLSPFSYTISSHTR